MLADSVAPSDGLPAVEMNAVVELGTAVMARSELQTLRTDLGPFAGHCWWCWKCVLDPAGNRLGEHGHPDGCERRERPDMSDFKQHKPRAGMRSGVNLKVSAKHRPQTTRTKEEQKEHRADYKTARVQRERALLDEAQLRTREWVLSIATQTSYYPLIIKETWQPRMQKIKCACLEPRQHGGRKVYTIDPNFPGTSELSKDKAAIALIFELPGEVLRPIEGGIETTTGHFDAWHLKLNAA